MAELEKKKNKKNAENEILREQLQGKFALNTKKVKDDSHQKLQDLRDKFSE